MKVAASGALVCAVMMIASAASAQPSDDAARAHAARVTIKRDAHGIAHVRGQTDADAVFGMIYAQAEDDFARIERNYLTALGRLAEAEGESALWQDVRQRFYVDERSLRREYADSSPQLRRLMDAWAEALNFFLATHREVKPRVLTLFEPWMALAFSEGSIGGDIETGIKLGPLAELYGEKQALASTSEPSMREPQGSNGIAIAPSKTRNGHALLLINPHTSFYFRSEAQVSSAEGLDVYGASTWGQFFVYQGFNRRLGWMHTSSGVDNIDEFAELVSRRNGRLVYRYAGKWRPVRERQVAIRVRSADGTLRESRFTLRFTHHGPLIRREGERMIAVAMMAKPRAALEQSFLRTKANSIAEFLRVSERKANSSNNTILASSAGEIAYLHPQFVPIRSPRFDYRLPVDGSDQGADWRGLHSLASLPSVVSPASGWVANTNNWPWSAAGSSSPRPADFPRYMDQLGENPRGIHAARLLAAGTSFTFETLRDLAFDPALPFFEQQLPRLRRAFEALPREDSRRIRFAAPVAALDAWDKRWGTHSIETTLAVFWGEALWRRESSKAAAVPMPMFEYLDSRTTDPDRLEALGEALDRLDRDWNGWRVPWGWVNRFQRLDSSIPPRFEDGSPSLPVGFTSGNFGSLASFGTVRPAGSRCLYGTSGNSFVAVVEFGPKLRAWAVSAGGESGDPQSPHFDDQAELYVNGRFRPVLLAGAEIAQLPSYRPGERALPRKTRSEAAPLRSRCGRD